MATPENEESQRSTSPTLDEKFCILRDEVDAGRARLVVDSEGKFTVDYGTEGGRPPLSHLDASCANVIHDVSDKKDDYKKIAACLESWEYIKKTRAPAGIRLDKTKITTKAGKYKEGKQEQFERVGEVLGRGNIAGDIVLIRDKVTGEEHAMKTVMLATFCENELKVWLALNNTEFVPKLYLFRLEDNKVHFHMENMKHDAVTLDKIIEHHMEKLCKKDPKLVRPFSLTVFHGLLDVVEKMHLGQEKWSHLDLHGGNVMLTNESMKIKLLDFGTAQPLKGDESSCHDHLEKDILDTIRMFTKLYIGNDFVDHFKLMKEIKEGTLRKTLSDTALALSEDDKDELCTLITKTYEVTSDPKQSGYGSTLLVRQHIEHLLYPDTLQSIRTKAPFALGLGGGDDRDMGEASGRDMTDSMQAAGNVEGTDHTPPPPPPPPTIPPPPPPPPTNPPPPPRMSDAMVAEMGASVRSLSMKEKRKEK